MGVQFATVQTMRLGGVRSSASDFGARRVTPRSDLAIDLAEDLFSARWWRGLATLAALIIATVFLAPRFGAIPAGHPAFVTEAEEAEFSAVGVASTSEGSATGMAMAPTSAVETLSSAPQRPTVALFLKTAPGDSLGRLLTGVGASYGDAIRADALIKTLTPHGLAAGTTVDVTLGSRQGPTRVINRLSLRAGIDLQLLIVRTAAGLILQRQDIAVDSKPLRIRGRVGDGLYWSLRAAGVTPQTASEYLQALSSQLDVGSQIAPDDRFDLVVANRRAATGESEAGELLFAGLDHSGGNPPLQLIKWTTGGMTRWFEASGVGKQTSGMIWPVSAPITSGFGERYHPILHFTRMHNGIDFGARYGTPIVAAADGQVERAGWAGGYGQQVRLAHPGGIETSYSHMSRMVVGPGSTVRQGQLIGYSGSTGLSTGPHLHYEVLRGGQPINPMNVRFISHSTLEGPALAAFKARLAALLAT